MTTTKSTASDTAYLLLGGIVGGLIGLHAGTTGNDIALSNAQQQATEVTQRYESCSAFVESRNATIDQFYKKLRGQNEPN